MVSLIALHIRVVLCIRLVLMLRIPLAMEPLTQQAHMVQPMGEHKDIPVSVFFLQPDFDYAFPARIWLFRLPLP